MTSDEIEATLTTTRRGTTDAATYTILRSGKPTGFTATRNGNEPDRSPLAWILSYQGADVDEAGTLRECKREVALRLAGRRSLDMDCR